MRKNSPKRLATAGPGVGGVGEGVGSRCGCVKVWVCEGVGVRGMHVLAFPVQRDV